MKNPFQISLFSLSLSILPGQFLVSSPPKIRRPHLMNDVMPPAPPAAVAGARQGKHGAGCCAGGVAGPYSAPATLVWSAAFSPFLVSTAAPELIFHSRWFISRERAGWGAQRHPPALGIARCSLGLSAITHPSNLRPRWRFPQISTLVSSW